MTTTLRKKTTTAATAAKIVASKQHAKAAAKLAAIDLELVEVLRLQISAESEATAMRVRADNLRFRYAQIVAAVMASR